MDKAYISRCFCGETGLNERLPELIFHRKLDIFVSFVVATSKRIDNLLSALQMNVIHICDDVVTVTVVAGDNGLNIGVLC